MSAASVTTDDEIDLAATTADTKVNRVGIVHGAAKSRSEGFLPPTDARLHCAGGGGLPIFTMKEIV